MRPSLLLLGLVASANASSWFGSSEPAAPYSSWSISELKSWLQAHNIPVPSKTPTQAELKALVQENWNTVSQWTYDQYTAAQKSFSDVQASTFDSWDESRLRSFLLAQGIVAPKGKKEQLVHLAKSQYRAYTNAASTFSDHASTAMYGDSTHQATQSLSSIAAHATNTASQVLDDTKDYIYSTWDDNKLRNYLESKGVQVHDQAKHNRNDLLGLMRDTYAKVTDPVYKAWSDSYLHSWLVSHNLISPSPPASYSREYLLNKMGDYYYDVNDSVYNSWSDSQAKNWLVQHGIIKSDAQLKREKMDKLVSDNYISAKSTLVSAWSDSQLRDYLVEHQYIDDRTSAQAKRDQLVKIFQDKYHSAVTPGYLVWPDARLRAYLRQRNIPEDKLPTSRPGLLQETRIRWVETQSATEALWARVRDIVGGVEGGIEGRLGSIWNILRNYGSQGDECAGQQCDCAGKDCKCSEGECACAGKDCDCFGAKCQRSGKGKKRGCVGEHCDCVGKDCKCSQDECTCTGKDCECFGSKCQSSAKQGKKGHCVGQHCDCVGKDCTCAEGECSCAGRDCNCFGTKCQNSARRAAGEKWEQGKTYAGEKYEDVTGRQYSESEKEYERNKERAYANAQATKETVADKIKAAAEKLTGGGKAVKTEL